MRFPTLFLPILFLALVPWAARASTQLPSELDRIPIYLLVDLSSGQTLAENEADRRFVPASITKVMTAFTAFEMIKNGELNQNQRLSIRPETFLEWRRKGSTMFLPVDAQVSVPQLLRGITTVSANDASIVLAEGASGSVENWIAQMNTNARRLGMHNSHFGTPNGWPDEGRTFVSARDLVALGSALIEHHPDLYARYFGAREMTFGGITQPNHNPLLGEVEGADGIKTGFTNEAGFGLLGSAQRNGRRLVMVVAGAQSSRERSRAARALIEWGFAAFESRPLNAAILERLSARVQNGSSSQLRLRPKPPFSVTMPAGKDPAITLELQYDGPLRAPIMAGTSAAELEISVEGMPTSRIPLFADQDVEKASFLRRIWNGIIGWFT